LESVEERAHRNFCDYTRWIARLHANAGLVDEAGVVAVAGPTDFPTARMALRTDRTLTPEQWVDVVDPFFIERGKFASVYARAGPDDDLTEALVARGYREWSTSPEMVCDHELDPREPAAGVSVRLASTPADISAYARIAAEAFGHLHVPEAAALDGVDHPDAMLADDSVVALAEIDGAPVAGAHAVVFAESHGAYVAWVSCLDAARGRGLGDTVTRAVTNEAFARGATLASLEASQYGEHTYARMGYREIYRYRMLIRL
jgi:ribosomal protein S18 acetylase RimI-like enzyme